MSSNVITRYNHLKSFIPVGGNVLLVIDEKRKNRKKRSDATIKHTISISKTADAESQLGLV